MNRLIKFSIKKTTLSCHPERSEGSELLRKTNYKKQMKREYHFYVYIMTNFNRTTFYIGFTNNIARRIIEYKYELSKGFVKKYKLKYLIYFEEYQYVNDAINKEKELKGWSRKKKLDLIKQDNINMIDLSEKLLKDYGIEEEEVKKYVDENK